MTTVNAQAGPSTTKTATIPIRLVSRSDSHAIPPSKYMIPADWRRYQLSELINKVLGNEQNVPFDFIINDELLRTSLGDWQTARGLTEETVLDVEYVESILPPKYLAAFEHDDWVSDIDMQQKGLFLTSSYDGSIRIFNSSGSQKAVLSGHKLAALSTCWLPSSSDERYLASGGMDRVVRVWKVPSGEDDLQDLQNTHALSLHTAPVSSVRSTSSSDQNRRYVLSSGWDGLVGFWDVDVSLDSTANEEPEEPRQSKKRKVRSNGASTTGERVAKVHPTLVLSGHRGQVSRAIFDSSSNARAAFSFGADDHSVRRWDLDAAGAQSGLKSSDKAILDGDQLASPNLLVSGNADRTVCLWDMREGHTSSVSSVSAHPRTPTLFASAGYDASVRIWDARSPKQALFTLARHAKSDGKLISLAWDGELIAAGGEDGKLELFQSKGV